RGLYYAHRPGPAKVRPPPRCRSLLRCSVGWNIFPIMRIGALVALLCVAACRNRPLARTAQQGDSVDLAQLVTRDSSDGTLLVPRVVTEPSVVLVWLHAADTLAGADRVHTCHR